MSGRIRVTEAELKRLWMTPEAVGMIHDHQNQTKGIRMVDGTEYETPFSELASDTHYRRSATGNLIHRADCKRAGKTSIDWHYAATTLGNDHTRVLAEIDTVSWLRACSYCMGVTP